LAAIRTRTKQLSVKSQDAKRDTHQFAEAAEELARTSGEIGRRVNEADALAENTAAATEDATRSADGLRTSSLEIGNVVNLIAAIARQTNLLALNATIEAAALPWSRNRSRRSLRRRNAPTNKSKPISEHCKKCRRLDRRSP
jgi:methyl-accepting chemotaxis protein